MADGLDLALRIKAAVEGARQVTELADEIRRVGDQEVGDAGIDRVGQSARSAAGAVDELGQSARQSAGDLDRHESEARAAADAQGELERSSGRLDGAMTRLGAGIGAVVAGLASVVSVQQALSAWQQQEQAVAALEASIASMGRTTDGLSGKLQALAGQIQQEGIIGDEAIIQGQSFLTTYSQITDDMLPRATRLMADLAAKMGGDTVSAANMVGKASMGMVGELQQVGITFSDAAKESRDFGLILTEMEQQVGGMNAALAATSSGALEQFRNKVGDVWEQVGRLLAVGLQDVFRDFSGSLDAQAIGDYGERLRELVADARELAQAFGELVPYLAALAAARALSAAWGLLAAQFATAAASGGVLTASMAGLSAAMAGLRAGLLALVGGPLGAAIAALGTAAVAGYKLVEMFGELIPATSLVNQASGRVEAAFARMQQRFEEIDLDLAGAVNTAGAAARLEQFSEESRAALQRTAAAYDAMAVSMAGADGATLATMREVTELQQQAADARVQIARRSAEAETAAVQESIGLYGQAARDKLIALEGAAAASKEIIRQEGESWLTSQAETNAALYDLYRNKRDALRQIAEEELRDIGRTLDQRYAQHKALVEKIKGLEADLAGVIAQAADAERDIRRQAMTDQQVYQDKLAEAAERQAEIARLRAQGDEEALDKLRQLAQEQYALARDLAASGDDAVGPAKAQQDALELVRQTAEQASGAIREQLETAKVGLAATGEQVDALAQRIQELADRNIDIKASLSGAEDVEAVIQRIRDMAEQPTSATHTVTPDTAAVEQAIERLKQDTSSQHTVYVREVAQRASGGPLYARSGRRLPGYGGGDRIPLLAESGEWVIRKEAVRHYGDQFMALVNSMRLPAIPGFATGGPVNGAALAAIAPAGSSSGARDVVDINVRIGPRSATLHGQRQQVRTFVDALRHLELGRP